MVTSVIGASLSTAAQAKSDPDAKTTALTTSGNAKAIAGYWTSSRLKSATTYLADSTVSSKLTKTGAAKAAADGKPGVVAPTGEGGKSAGMSKNLNLPITVGKVFFIDDKGKTRWCSGSSVQSKYRNLVATAGHCVYDTDTNKPFSNFVFIPGYYQGKAPWGIYVGAKVNTHDDFTVYEDYDYDYAFVNVYNGIKQTGVKEVTASQYAATKSFKYTEDKAISQAEFEKGIEKYGEKGPYWKKSADPDVQTIGKPADAEKYLEDYIKDGRNGVKLTSVEVTESTYKAAAANSLENHARFERFSDANGRVAISKEQYDQLVKDKADGKVLAKLEAPKDANGNEIAWYKTQYFVKKWVKTSVKELYYYTRFFVVTLADAGRLGDNVGGQGFMWNQSLGKKVFTFGYPTAPHLDGDKPYSGQTQKWCYGTTGAAPVVSAYKAEEQQAIKCAFTPGASGGPFLLQYKSSKRTGYLNGVVSLTVDSDKNGRYDRVTTPYFNGDTYGIYKYAANLWTGKLPA